jgi:pyridoxine kinase
MLSKLHPPVLLVSDLPAWGRVALASAIPLIEAAGFQACALPTALLSTHGAYPGFVLEPQSRFLDAGWRHLKSLEVTFAGVIIGFVGELQQFAVLEDIAATVKAGGGLVLVDPILGDNGKRYGLFHEDYVPAFRSLLAMADIITPNLTEAAMLLDHAPDLVPKSEAETAQWTRALSTLGPKHVVLTSAPFFDKPGTTGVAWYDGSQDQFGTVSHVRLEGGLPGTGDALAARLFAALLSGRRFDQAVDKAVRATLADFKRSRASKRPPLWGLAGTLRP